MLRPLLEGARRSAVLERFSDVVCRDFIHFRQVGDALSDTDETKIASRRETIPFDGVLEQRLGILVERSEVTDETAAEFGVGLDVVRGEPFRLSITCLLNALLDVDTRFSRLHACKFFSGDLRNLHAKIDTIKQWSAQPFLIGDQLTGRADARSILIGGKSAGAGVHRREERETSRKRIAALSPANRNNAVFKRLAQALKYGSCEFGKFV